MPSNLCIYLSKWTFWIIPEASCPANTASSVFPQAEVTHCLFWSLMRCIDNKSWYFKDTVCHRSAAFEGLVGRGGTEWWRTCFGGRQREFAEFPRMLCYSWPCPQLWPLTPAEICHEKGLLNTKWSLVQESEAERDMHRVGERERETVLHRTQRTHLSSPSLEGSFFSSSLCFHCTETVALSSYTSPLSFLPPHLLTLVWLL